MIMILFALAAAAPALREFDDWVVGCDNGRTCQASAYAPRTGEGGATLTLVRAPSGDSLPQISVNPLSNAKIADVAVDGRALGLSLIVNEVGVQVASKDSLRFARALRSARQARVVGANGRDLGVLEVRGAAAAMLLIDERQQRIGTRSALVRQGSRSDTTVPQAPALPVIQAARGSSRPAAAVARATLDQLIKRDDCKGDHRVKAEHIARQRLDARHTLLGITFLCQSGAYNIVSSLTIIPDRRAPRPARFDKPPTIQEGLGRLIYNVRWDAADRRLYTGFKARGIGDCGVEGSYAWDGSRFRLVESSAMSDCRSVTDYIVTFRAWVVER